MYRFIKYFIYTIISLYLLLNLALYGTYKYQLSKIDTTKITQHKSYDYKDDVYATYWATFAHTSDMEMKPFYSFDFPLELYKILNSKDINDRYYNDSLILCNRVTLSTMYGEKLTGKRKSRQLERNVHAIWMTHNLTTKEVMDIFFSKMYYANKYYSLVEASHGYFRKEVNELDTYELIMLHAITHAPSHYNPRKHKVRLLNRVNRLIKRAKVVFPVRYKDLKDLSLLPNFEDNT